jgi:recombination protein RecA
MAKKGKSTAKGNVENLTLFEAKMASMGYGDQLKTGKDLEDVEFLPTGQPEIDSLLGNGGGIPRGSLVELAGESMSGKTYLSYKIMAEENKLGNLCCYVNVENSFFPPRAAECGVEVDDPNLFRILEDIETAEEYGEVIFAMVESGLFGVITVDSISALIPDDDFNKTLDETPKIGEHAKFIKRFVKKLAPMCKKSGTIVILINQFYMGQSDVSFPGAQTMQKQATGGNAMNFFPHVRFWMNPVGGKSGKIIDDDGEVIGGKSKFLLKKTRYSPPYTECTFPIMFGAYQRDFVHELIHLAKLKMKDTVKEVRKVLYYYSEDGEELIKTKDKVAFVVELMATDPPETLPRGVKAETAFDWVVNRTKFSPKDVESLQQQLQELSNIN